MGCGSSSPSNVLGIETDHITPIEGTGKRTNKNFVPPKISHGSNNNDSSNNNPNTNATDNGDHLNLQVVSNPLTSPSASVSKVNGDDLTSPSSVADPNTNQQTKLPMQHNPHTISSVSMIPIIRDIDDRELATIKSIFSSLDLDKNNDISNDELGALFSIFGFELDRIAIESVSTFLRKGGGDNSNDATSTKIDLGRFISKWPTLLSYCERMSAALHYEIIPSNPTHRGETFDNVLIPFVDAGFGNGKVIKAPHIKGRENNLGDHNDAIHLLIDRITSSCYERSVLFRDSYFEPTADKVSTSSHSAVRTRYSKWARISELSSYMAAEALSEGVGRIGSDHNIDAKQARVNRRTKLQNQYNAALSKHNLDPTVYLNNISAAAFAPPVPTLYIQGTDSTDIVNNNWSGSRNRYAAGITSLADRFDLLKDSIYPPHYNPAGIYGVRVFRDNEWYWVIVDDYIPVDGNNVPLFLRSKTPNEIWPLIIDKAFAKIKGSYERLHGNGGGGGAGSGSGRSSVSSSLLVDPLYLLAGCQPATLLLNSFSRSSRMVAKQQHMSSSSTRNQHQQPQRLYTANSTFSGRCDFLFAVIKAYVDLNWFVVASPSAATNSYANNATAAGGLVLDNSYSVIDYFEAFSDDEQNVAAFLPTSKGATADDAPSPSSLTRIRLLRCRSPWGALEWQGKWSDADEDTWKNKFPNLAKVLKIDTDQVARNALRKKLRERAENSRDSQKNDHNLVMDRPSDEDGCFWIQVEDLLPRFGLLHCWGLMGAEVMNIVNSNHASLLKKHANDLASKNSSSSSSSEDEDHSEKKSDALPSKSDMLAKHLPPTIAPFASILQWSGMEKCWHDAVDAVHHTIERRRDFTEKRSFLLMGPSINKSADGSLPNESDNFIQLKGVGPIMSPFDCPQYIISIPRRVEGSTDEHQNSVTFYFRARRVLFGGKKIKNQHSSDSSSDSASDTDDNNAQFLKTELSKQMASETNVAVTDETISQHVQNASTFEGADSMAISSPQCFIVKAPNVVDDKMNTKEGVESLNHLSSHPSSHRILTIPTGKNILVHSAGAYTRVTLTLQQQVSNFVLMVMVADHPEIPMKLTFRTRRVQQLYPPISITPINKCEGVSYVTNLKLEALGEVIHRHGIYISLRDGLGGMFGSTKLAPAGKTTTVTTHQLGVQSDNKLDHFEVESKVTTTDTKITRVGGRNKSKDDETPTVDAKVNQALEQIFNTQREEFLQQIQQRQKETSAQRPVLSLSSVKTVQREFEGNLNVPTAPHTFTPIIKITPSSLTIKHVTIFAATNRKYNFSSDRAGEFTIGCMKKNSSMLTSKTTVTRTNPKTKETITVSGSYFDWREFTHDNVTSELQQTLKANGQVNSPTMSDRQNASLEATNAAIAKVFNGGSGFTSNRTSATPIAAASSASSFGFQNIVSINYLGVGHPFAALPFFTGDLLSASNDDYDESTLCLVAVWSPEGKVTATV